MQRHQIVTLGSLVSLTLALVSGHGQGQGMATVLATYEGEHLGRRRPPTGGLAVRPPL